MASAWESVKGTYNYLFDELSHPTTKGWFLVSSPLPLLTILVSYNIFCTKVGPWLMKDRKPFELKRAIHLYNIFQVLISLYLTYEGCVYVFSGKFDFNCQAVNGENRIARAIQAYFLTKLLELLDTIFFVLRKSDRQITFLHLYHHTLMPILSWIGLKYIPGGQSVLIGLINSFVHVVMYTYYLVSALGPQYQKYLWWKKYLTVMQIVQFTIILMHSVHSLFHNCKYHIVLKILTILEASVFIYLFSKFYYNSYIKRKSSNGANNGKAVINGEKINGESKEITINRDYNSNASSEKANGLSQTNDHVHSDRKVKNL